MELETDAYTRSRVTYRSGDLTISGVLLRPHGPGPFPGIVLNHGYIEPPVYATGQGLAREQDWLARQGFAVLHTDYRGHYTSDPPVGPFDRETRLGYTRDAINAVLALEREPYVDPDRMAMLGRSMGGGITLNALVAYPGLVDAAVIYASVSSSFPENLEHFTEPNRPEELQQFYAHFGTPAGQPPLLPRPLLPHLLRPDHRAAPDPPRHRRRDLPVPLGPDHPAPARARGRRQHVRGLRGRAPRLRAEVAGLDRADGALPPPPPGLSDHPHIRCYVGETTTEEPGMGRSELQDAQAGGDARLDLVRRAGRPGRGPCPPRDPHQLDPLRGRDLHAT